MAEFEQQLIRERSMAGVAAARAQGRRGGQPVVMTPDKIKAARQMYESRDYTVAAIAAIARRVTRRHLQPPRRDR
jgi:DNA invertase Pin-like site-specific DNA recombinase